MKKILIVSGHPDIDGDSIANKTILEELAKLLPEVDIDRLDALYPDYRIGVKAEQEKFVDADIIVFQYQYVLMKYDLQARWEEKDLVVAIVSLSVVDLTNELSQF